MKKTRVSLTERKGTGLKQSQISMQKKPTPKTPGVMIKSISVNMVSTRSTMEQKAKEKTLEEQSIPAKETDLETPDQSIDGIERKTTESTPMPNTVEQEKNTTEFSTIGNQEEATNTPETFTERKAAMVGMKPRIEEATAATEKSKTFATVSTITTETMEEMGAVSQEAAFSPDERSRETRTTSVELRDLMTKLNEIDKKLKCSEEDQLKQKKRK